MDGLENGASEVRNHFIFLLSPLAVAAISFRTPALCVGTAMRGWRAWGEGTAWAQLQGSPAPPGVTPKNIPLGNPTVQNHLEYSGMDSNIPTRKQHTINGISQHGRAVSCSS